MSSFEMTELSRRFCVVRHNEKPVNRENAETVEEFLARGGVIQQIPRGVTGMHKSMIPKSVVKDHEKRRVKGGKARKGWNL